MVKKYIFYTQLLYLCLTWSPQHGDGVMQPLLSFFGLELSIAVKLVCKSFLVLSTLTLTINLYHLDYEGPRQESTLALGVVFLFLTLLTGSAFMGHSGADRDGLCPVVLSLCLLILAVIHWFVLGILSMQKGNPYLMWTVCLQNRCAESLWILDIGFRVVPANQQVSEFSERKGIPHPYWTMVGGYVAANPEGRRVDMDWSDTPGVSEHPQRTNLFRERGTLVWPFNDRDDKRSATHKPVDFWQTITERDYGSQDPASGMSLLITLGLYLVLCLYFLICATVTCSYCAQLYDEYRMYNDDYEEEEKDDEGSQGSRFHNPFYSK